MSAQITLISQMLILRPLRQKVLDELHSLTATAKQSKAYWSTGWVRDCPGIAAEGTVEWLSSKEKLRLEGLGDGNSRQPLAVDPFEYVVVVGGACFGRPV